MIPFASLPMYDWPECAGETQAFWDAVAASLRRRGVKAQGTLRREGAREDHWRDPALLLGQTCGWPWATAFRTHLHLVATPCYAVEGCSGPSYSSALVVRGDSAARGLADLYGGRVAFNGADSQSGVHALRETLAPLCVAGTPFFARGLRTGAHRASIRAVAEGRADCAAIDAVCWAMAGRVMPEILGQLRVLAWTLPAPALPFVTASGNAPLKEMLVEALHEAIADGAGTALGLAAVAPADPAGYLALPDRVAEAPPLAPGI